ncbi:MAG: superoxide dismutase [Gammaproteobacteria bacterium]
MSLKLPPLPYALDALEPHISPLTLSLHHGRHHAGYVERARQLVQGTPLESAPLERVVLFSDADPDRALFNAAAQAWNHDFYWHSMRARGGGKPHGEIARLVAESFGSHEAFCQAFIQSASAHFGSGWAWLVLDGERLCITTTENAGTPLLSPQVPLLTVDVWEHAYYPDYQNRRVDYVAAYLTHLVNWEFANQKLEQHASARGEVSSLQVPIPASARR